MAAKEFVLPIRGFSLSTSPDNQPEGTTGYMDNMFPVGTFERWMRLVQRPGLDKTFSQQIGGGAVYIAALLSVTTVD